MSQLLGRNGPGNKWYLLGDRDNERLSFIEGNIGPSPPFHNMEPKAQTDICKVKYDWGRWQLQLNAFYKSESSFKNCNATLELSYFVEQLS